MFPVEVMAGPMLSGLPPQQFIGAFTAEDDTDSLLHSLRQVVNNDIRRSGQRSPVLSDQIEPIFLVITGRYAHCGIVKIAVFGTPRRKIEVR